MSIQTIKSLLAAQKWRDADLVTADYLFSLMGQRTNKWLAIEDIDRISCEYLAELNQAWLDYSNGHFGFTVQESIHRRLKDKYTSAPYKGLNSLVSEIMGGSNNKVSSFQMIQIVCWFDAEVGWLVYNPERVVGYDHNDYLSYDQLTFNFTAPKGHLPSATLGRIRYESQLVPFDLLFKKYGVKGLIGCTSKYSYEIESHFFKRINICCKQGIYKQQFPKVEQLDLFGKLNNTMEGNS